MTYTRLNPTAAQQHVGDYYSAAWTADSSSANGTRLTNTITLPAGTYLICMMVPVINTETFAMAVTIPSSGAYLTNQCIHVGIGQSSKAVVVKLTESKTIAIAAAQSFACTFSYKERGGLIVVRLA